MNRYTMPVAVHLFLIKNNQILLLRRYNTGYEDGNYSVPAGHVDGNESYIKAMIREAKEELGITITPNNLNPIQVMHRKSDDERIDYFFSADFWSGEIENMEPNKCDELKWCDITDLPINIIPYIQFAIQEHLNQNCFTDFGW